MKEHRCKMCASCCKTSFLLVTASEEQRIKKLLKAKGNLNSGEYCHFLQPDNKCGIYSDRPKSCEAYRCVSVDGERKSTMDLQSFLAMVDDQPITKLYFGNKE